MRLLYTNFHGGDGGGHTTYVVALARALAARHEVHVAAPAGSRLLREAGALPGVHAVAQAFPNGLKQLRARMQAQRALAALLRAHDFDLVHVNGSADHRLVMAALRGLRRRPRIVLTKHNSKPMTGLGHWWRARRGTDQVIAVCDYTLRHLQESAYRHCRLDTVHNGIDIAHYAPWPVEAAEAERRHWIGETPALVLGSNAGTALYKGWMDLVEALALLPAPLREQIQVLVAGKPPASAQQQRIAELGLTDRVHFPGLLADVRPALAAIDVGFVLSYDVETISFACREMMAMGKPVLLSDYAGLPENIEIGREGWLVPVKDPRAVADALEWILEQRHVLPAMGVAARERAELAFGLDLFVERTEAVYARLLQG
ncbi:glycosyltransferase family 4 protein [Lysobacter niabensis]|uniref:glycosyltransferase family 4 protein n=1 Tax=Agrilutibacter niabensis TaxID=380628 RepID=UPI0036217A9A